MRPEDAARIVGWWLGHRRRFYQNIGDSLPALDQAAHDFLAVRFMETSLERHLPPPWRLAFEGPGGRVWENPQALSLFFMPRLVERVEDLDDAQQAAMRADDLAAAAWIAAGSWPGAAAAQPGGTSTGPGARPSVTAQDGRVLALRPRSNGFDLDVASASGGLVASSVSYAADWQVILDRRERPVPAVEVNRGVLRLALPPGTHAVRLRYRPRGWSEGLALAVAGLVAALAAWWGRRRGWRALARL